MFMRSARRAGVGGGTVVGLLLLIVSLNPARAADRRARNDASSGSMQQYPSPYYDIYSDLEPDRVQEAVLRMTRMAEEYHERTKEFSGAINQKFPFYLFRNPQDYLDAGGLPGSGGVFMVRGGEAKLMAIAGEKSTNGTWHTVQHEG